MNLFGWFSDGETSASDTKYASYPDQIDVEQERTAVRIHFENSDPNLFEYHDISTAGVLLSYDVIEEIHGYNPETEEWDISWRTDGLVNSNSIEYIDPLAYHTDTFEVPVVTDD